MDPNKEEGSGDSETIVQVMDSLGFNRGGLTRAVFDRFRLVSEGRRAIVVTVDYQPDVRAVFESLVAAGQLPSHATLLNFDEDQRAQLRDEARPIETPHVTWESTGVAVGAPEPVSSGTFIRYFQEGTFLGLVSRDMDGHLRMVEKHDENRPWVREFRDTPWANGAIAKREYYDDRGRPRFRIYIGADMRPYLSTWVNENGYEYRTAEHIGSETIFRGDARGANAAWLTRKLGEIGPVVVFTDEPRTTFALTIGGQNIRHVTTVHTTHYRNNQDSSEGLKHWTNHYTDNFERVDAIVFFTDMQRRDFVNDTNCPPAKTFVIPHAAPLGAASDVAWVERHPRRLVSVSRLADDKRLEDAIRAFAKVAPAIPEAEFRIYGAGAAERPLRELVAELDAEESISLEGPTDAPLECFAGSAASILTSRYEGFGLVILESFATGTPVISYDVIYGPRNIIESGVNGFLCPDGDIDSLAEAIMLALGSFSDSGDLELGSREKAEQYTPASWASAWQNIVPFESRG